MQIGPDRLPSAARNVRFSAMIKGLHHPAFIDWDRVRVFNEQLPIIAHVHFTRINASRGLSESSTEFRKACVNFSGNRDIGRVRNFRNC